MGLSIILNKRYGQDSYTSLDDVSGVITLRNKNSVNVRRVTVYLEGILRKSIKPINATQDGAFGNTEHILFSRQSIIFQSTSDTPRDSYNTFGPGIHSLPFNLEVPLVTDSSTGKSNVLPPSFQLSSITLRVSATYRLRAVVERSGIFKRQLSLTHNVDFIPLGPPRVTQHSVPLRIAGHLAIDTADPQTRARLTVSAPPAYTPSITLEVVLPSKTLYPGDRLDYGVKIAIPTTEMRAPSNMYWLESLIVRLRTTTSAPVGCCTRSNVGYINIHNMQGLLPLEPGADGRYAVPSDLWKNQILPQVLPSFQAYGVRRSYKLEFVASIISTLADTYTIAASVEVDVESSATASSEAPPDYYTTTTS